MRVRAQVGMVMNLDKCIGCHTCSVTCKQVWTNRPGTEYVWFNDVETKPGLGYPKRWEDQEQWKGGWELDKKGRLRLKAGGRVKKLLNIFANPDMPQIDDYYEPWTYDYEKLITAPLSEHDPVARARSQLTGKALQEIQWGPNWDDNLAGTSERIHEDPLTRGIEEQITASYEQAFMFYLPRICEHCLNPSCVASCPSGAMYKREEDGIVLVDQAKCRGWRMCVSGCPYKKVYFNHQTGKAEKCTLCYPRIEIGLPTICSETCVGRIRYIGLVLYDSDRVEAAASVPDEHDLLDAQRDVFLDPEDPAVREQAARDGIPDDWITAARRSPVYALAHRYRVALPLHPEFRTLPMVWYVPPLSPIVNSLESEEYEADPDHVFGAIDQLRIPVDYLANLLAAGDAGVIRDVLHRLAAMRVHMRKRDVLGEHDTATPASVGMSVDDVEDMYRLLAIAKYEDRYVIPQAHAELGQRLMEQQGTCGLDFAGGPGNCGAIPGPGDSAADTEGFMLLDGPAQLDIVQIASGRSSSGGAAGRAVEQRRGGTMTRLGRSDRAATATAFKLCSLLLSYPDAELLAARAGLAVHVEEVRAPRARAALERFCDWWTGAEPLALAQHYVQTFDLDKRCSLYLTFYGEGDKRTRGAALLRLKRMYRAAGLPLAGSELPDYLPAMLEFAADAPQGRGELALREHRAAIELLRLSLHDRQTPYADVLEAVDQVLGGVSPGERAKAIALAAGGPPQELVGLEPFAPPEVMPSAEARR